MVRFNMTGQVLNTNFKGGNRNLIHSILFFKV